METKVIVPVEQLLHGARIILVGILRQTAVVGSTVADLRVVIDLPVGGCTREVALHRGRETVRQHHRGKGHSFKSRAAALVVVGTQLKSDVSIRQIIRFRVELLFSVFVEQERAVIVVQVNGIDGSHIASRRERVGIVAARCVGVVVAHGMGSVQVDTRLQPLHRSELCVDTACEALVVAGEHVTLLVQIACRGVDVVPFACKSLR